MELISNNLNINFLAKAKFAIAISLFLMGYSIFIWFQQGDSKYGVDYTGGHEFIVSSAVDANKLRSTLGDAGLDGAVVQEFEVGSGEYSIRLSGEFKDSKDAKDQILANIRKADPKAEIIASNFIGPTVGAELRRSAIIAIIIGLVGMLAYITYRFEFAFALGAVAALFHDVVICVGVSLFLGIPLSMITLASAMTIIGYSLNDTIVIFDRIREEMTKRKEFVLDDVVNYSLNVTLSRTILTSLLTLFSALALLIFGGGAIKEMAVLLVAGLIAGSYSTVFIASPVALAWEKWAAKRS